VSSEDGKMEYSRFSDFAKEDRHFEGPKKGLDEILDSAMDITFRGSAYPKTRMF
jgi:hypothetical protein